jgi:hypothetical protein
LCRPRSSASFDEPIGAAADIMQTLQWLLTTRGQGLMVSTIAVGELEDCHEIAPE